MIGFQAACSEHVFAVLNNSLGVAHECFASPLNCHFPSFCSAFPDTDRPFGSAGSFWAWAPDPKAGGSFQANPPFVADVMLRLVQRLDSFFWPESLRLSRKKKPRDDAAAAAAMAPLSFICIVPGWSDDEAIKRLSKHPLLRLRVVVPKKDHGFCDGAQHQVRNGREGWRPNVLPKFSRSS